ncbi:MAG: glycosyltransferase family 39 protein [Anaerolineae bacterium]
MPEALGIDRMRGWHRYKMGLLALVLLAFALRVYRLDNQSLWSDEFISLFRSRQPLPQLLANMPVEHAPLYFVLLHFWLGLAGEGDFALRFPSLAFGLLTVPLTYSLAAALFDRRVGLLAAFLMAVNPFQVWYGQEARMYTLTVALGLGSLLFLVRGLRGGGAADWLGYVLATTLALYTHYYAALIVLVGLAFALWRLWSSAQWLALGRRWLAAQAAIGLLYLPWLPRAWRLLAFPGWREPLDLAQVPARYATVYTLGTSIAEREGLLLTLGYLALAGLGLAAMVHAGRVEARSREGLVLVACYAGLPLLVGALLALRKPDFHERYFIVATPAYYLAVARGLAALQRSVPLGLAALAFVALTSGYSLHNHYFDIHFAKSDYRGLTHYIAAHYQEGDGLIVNGTGEGAIRRYYPGEVPKLYNLRSTRYRRYDDAQLVELFQKIARRHPRVWMAVQGRGPDFAKMWFVQHGFLAEERGITDIALMLYTLPRQPLPPMSPPASMTKTGPAELVGYALTPSTAAPGEIINLALFWRTPVQLAQDYKVSVRLVDAQGHVVLAVDRPPQDGFAPTSAWEPGQIVEDRYGLWVPLDAASGVYQMVVKLYEERTWAEVVDAVLGPVTVTEGGGP